jgi:signal transduction histidine kinase
MPDTVAMPETVPSTRRSRLIDAVLAACVAIPGIAAIPFSKLGGTSSSALTVVALLVGGASVYARYRYPVVAVAAAAATYVVAAQAGSFNPNGSSVSVALVTVGVLLWTVVMSYSLGSFRPLSWSLVGLALVIVVTQWNDLNSNFNPFPTMLAIGPWLVGWLMRSHRELARALDARAAELSSERQRYAAEAVRYERARIARELHDVVAHCMSIVVVQASAGQRLDDADPAVTDQLLDDIRELARQAECDMAGLTRLLQGDSESASARPLSRAVLDQLVDHARSAGTAVEMTVTGDLGAVPAPAAAALGRVLQEGLTNAVKHAPGAPVVVTFIANAQETSLEIRSAPGVSASSPLQGEGGGNGLRGLAERVTELGGTLHGAPTTSGGWLLSAVIPTAADELDWPAELQLTVRPW